ncbi:outer membrane protein assembly factor BamD [Arenimonas terrae]|jgi:outer membrane protein assembly factor BamD|uniref:Outer membrane protein assembly factor BamD n=1 Tax=Arenimonas terrae TaxID=2546226 RepID=A0A5C4RXQ1_9GAMM|nr:outer membrane protein assembly factor BamD [Arenimonas terrae]TNJ35477.1 outer membrane protein assembly factor BamD [Arenimonas terrae]
MTRLPGTFRVLLILMLLTGLSGCQSLGKLFGGKEEPTETLPVEEMYREAKGSMDGHNYDRAARYYQRLAARFPYGAYSEQAQLELAYVLHKQAKTEEATSAINRFIRTYPTHRHIDYAYYLKALINFDRASGLLLRLARQDMSARDLGAPTQSLNDFADVVRRYPNSRYAPDARQRMIYLRNLLARHELNVGLYYLRRDAFVAAANRGKYVLQTYPQSEYDGDAVALMAAAYTELGQEQLAADARKVLELNYPDHEYLDGGAWPKGTGFFSRLNPFD